jgi:hypothetical protein
MPNLSRMHPFRLQLPFSRRLRIALGPDRVIVGHEVIRTDAPLEVFSEQVSKRKKSKVTVVLANAHARYALLPANDTLKTEEQWLAFAQHRLSGVLADAADWDLRVADTGGARLAAALPRRLLEELDARAEAAGATLVSVQPYLVAAFNVLRSRGTKGNWWLVMEEPRQLTLALMREGSWTAVRARRVDDHWRVVLPEILERESALLGVDAPQARVTLCADGAFEETFENLALEALEYRRCAMAGG